ncbi:hypothetical protein AX16_008683 [Volvariella volvacea WC 439]|nr:hypothetical protein AX16_008683 [Volvariella volvacea WC 439]
MARSRRRSAPQDSQVPHTEVTQRIEQGTSNVDSDDNTCPACSTSSEGKALDKQNWIRCDNCKKWFHWGCAGNGTNVEIIDQWFCSTCLEDDPKRTITLKPPTRKSVRKRAQRDYASLHAGTTSDPNRWLHILEGKRISPDPFKRMHGQDMRLHWLEEDDNAMREPVIIEQPDGLDMSMPPSNFTVSDVVQVLGEDHPVEVIDVATQAASPNWTLGKWGQYYCDSARDKVLNVISLEISGTPLAQSIIPPRLVRELDWVESYWPSAKKGKGHAYPKVQLYCLMGVATAWTDWHVDFAGSSVYYHILRGSKVFYFIRPSRANLAAYERWSGTELQTHVWLGDMADEVYKVELKAGNTMIIPSGWIHAVYTPEDTLVFGGNFLHSYDVATQLRVCEIENATHVPRKFRFPLFTKLCWYVGEQLLREIKNTSSFSSRVLCSIAALAEYLVSEVRILERGSDTRKKEVKENIPHDKVKDPSALARELRWRVKIAMGNYSDEDDTEGWRQASRRSKRKRSTFGNTVAQIPSPKFRNFKPKLWERVEETSSQVGTQMRKADKPEHENWANEWVQNIENDASDGEDVKLEQRRDIVVKVRRTDGGVERHRIERVVEVWEWQ